MEALGLGKFFVNVYGGNSFATKKPDPEGAQTILRETGSRPEETLLVGDSAVDVATGRNAGTWTCGVTYGFAPHTLAGAEPDVVVDSPQELEELFCPRPRAPGQVLRGNGRSPGSRGRFGAAARNRAVRRGIRSPAKKRKILITE